MRTRDFDYELPPELIAQQPCDQRDRARLLLVDRADRALRDRVFDELPDLLPDGALLVLNDSRVFPARLRGHKRTGGAVEVLLVSPVAGTDDPARWSCLCRSSKGLSVGQEVRFEPHGDGLSVTAVVERVAGGGVAELAFAPGGDAPADPGRGWFERWVDSAGETPLPPYIQRPAGALDEDRERYQTVYARVRGSVAAPTAGLHFTDGLLARLDARGVERAFVTLHVGPGTFRPVRAEQVSEHRMDAEHVHVGEGCAEAVTRAHAAGRPVIAVGTTTVRALEGAARAPGALEPGHHAVELFITPGYGFRVVSGLITNFHLPRSTLLMLVSALAGRELVLEAYRHAVAARYRFYSYGDAMLIR